MIEKKKLVAWFMAILMVIQMLPTNILAEAVVFSGVNRGAKVYTVTFKVAQSIADDGAITYEEIQQLVEEGKAPEVPDKIPDIEGWKTTGWDKTIPDAITSNETFTATYTKIETVKVTVEFKYSSGSEARQALIYEYEKGKGSALTVTPDTLTGFDMAVTRDGATVELQDGSFVVDVPALTADVTYVVTYSGRTVAYTVNHHVQNIENADYTVTVQEPAPTGIAGEMTEAKLLDADWTGFTIPSEADVAAAQKTIAPDGTTVIDFYYERNTYKLTYETNGGSYLMNEVIPFGATIEIPEITKQGYTLKWELYNAQENVKLRDHDAGDKITMPDYDIRLEAVWTAVESASYTIMYWVQGIDTLGGTKNVVGSDGKIGDDEKYYEFLKSETGRGKPGDVPSASVFKTSATTHGLSSTFFKYNKNTSTVANPEPIAADGSTVYHVRFDRAIITFTFGSGSSAKKMYGLYGQTFAQSGNAWPGGRWSGSSALSGNWTYLDGFNHPSLSDVNVTFTKASTNYTGKIYQYIETLDSTETNRKWEIVKSATYENGSGNFNVTGKFEPGFSLYGYSIDDDKTIYRNGFSSVEYEEKIYVYNTRNAFRITYANCVDENGNAVPDKTGVKFEAPLPEPDFTPYPPAGISADQYEFAGWYREPAPASAQITPVNWGEDTMPAANLVVYAKWVPKQKTVTYHYNDGVTADVSFIVYSGDTLSAHHYADGQYVDTISSYADQLPSLKDAPVRAGYRFDGWYTDAACTKPLDGGFATAQITKNYDVYAKWVSEQSGTATGSVVTTESENILGYYDENNEWVPIENVEMPTATGKVGETVYLTAPVIPGYEPVQPIVAYTLQEGDNLVQIVYRKLDTWNLIVHYQTEDGKDIVAPVTYANLIDVQKTVVYKALAGGKDEDGREYIYRLVSAPVQTAAKQDAVKDENGNLNVTLTFQYKKVYQAAYTVEHYLEQSNGKFVLTATDSLKDWTGYTVTAQKRNDLGSDYTFKSGISGTKLSGTVLADGSLVLKLYYELPRYEVRYKPGDQGTFEDDVHSNQIKGASTPAFAGTTGADGKPAGNPGYTFADWQPKVANTVTEPAAYVAQWTPIDYTVSYTYDGDLPDAHVLPPLPANLTEKHVGETITVAAAPAQVPGYSFSGWAIKEGDTTITDGKFTMPASNVVLVGRFTRNTLSNGLVVTKEWKTNTDKVPVQVTLARKSTVDGVEVPDTNFTLAVQITGTTDTDTWTATVYTTNAAPLYTHDTLGNAYTYYIASETVGATATEKEKDTFKSYVPSYDGLTVTNTNKYSIVVTKEWKDAWSDAELTNRPTVVFELLLPDGTTTGKTAEIKTLDRNKITATFTDVSYNADGYVIEETMTDGDYKDKYESSWTNNQKQISDTETSVEVTNTILTAPLTITKVIDNASAIGTEDLSSLYFRFDVKLNGETKDTVYIAGGTSATVENLLIGAEYTVEETGVYTKNGDVYTEIVNGMTAWNTSCNAAENKVEIAASNSAITFTNERVRYTPDDALTFSKQWADNGDAYGRRPSVADFASMLTLWDKNPDTAGNDDPASSMANTAANANITAPADQSANWTITFTNLPKYKLDGTEYEYTLVETLSGNTDTWYTATTSSATAGEALVNTIKTVNVTVTKSVTDQTGEYDKKTYDPFTINVSYTYANNAPTALSEKDTTSLGNGDSETYTLPYGAKVKAEEAKNNAWSVTYSDNNDTTFTADGTITVTNTREKTTGLTVTKTWITTEGAKTPDLVVTVKRAVNRTEDSTWSRDVTLTAEKSWAADLGAVPTYDQNGNEYTYYVAGERAANEADAEELSKYTASVASLEITNTLTDESITVEATKTWENDTSVTVRYPEVTLQLYSNAAAADTQAPVTGKTVTLDGTADQNGEISAWKAQFTGLPRYAEVTTADGTVTSKREIVYTVQEGTAPTGYTKSESGLNVTNTRTTIPAGTLQFTKKINNANADATKTAKDQFDFVVTMPSDVTGGTVTYRIDPRNEGTVTATVTNGTFRITGIKAGETAVITSVVPAGTYSVTEECETYKEKNFYTYSYKAEKSETSDYVFTVTNTPELYNENGQLTVTKKWTLNGATLKNGAVEVPASTQIQLKQKDSKNGEVKVFETVTLSKPTAESEANADAVWTYTFTNLPAKNPADGGTYVYTVEEVGVNAQTIVFNGFTYDVAVTGSNASFEITNAVQTTSIEVTKKWELNGVTFTELPTPEFGLYYGENAGTKYEATVARKTGTENENEWVFANVPVRTDYVVKETALAGGTVVNNGVDDKNAAAYFDFVANDSKFTAQVVGGKAEITNTATVGVLQITKAVELNGEALSADQSFEITATWQNDSAKFAPAFAASESTANPQSVTSGQILVPLDTEATISEATPDDWTAVYSEETVTIGTTPKTVTVTNYRNITAQVSKAWADASNITVPNVTITLERTTDSQKWETVGTKTIESDKTTMVEWTKLPRVDASGTEYTYRATEALPSDAQSYTLDTEATTGKTLTSSSAAPNVFAATFVNTRDRMSKEKSGLSITKTIDNGDRGVTDQMKADTFNFTVTMPADVNGGTVSYQITGDGASGTVQTATVTNHAFTIEGVKHGQTVTVNGMADDDGAIIPLPAGQYSVAETQDTGNVFVYAVTFTPASSANVQKGSTGVAFTATNVPGAGTATIQKLWEQPNGAGNSATPYGLEANGTVTATFGLFAGTTQIAAAGLNADYETVTFDVPKDGQTYTIKELEHNQTGYYQDESAANALEVCWDAQGEVFKFAKGTAIINKLKRTTTEAGAITIEKVIDWNGTAAETINVPFAITYSYTDTDRSTKSGTVKATYSAGKVAYDIGEAGSNVEVVNDIPTLTDIAYGTVVTVAETPNAAWKMTTAATDLVATAGEASATIEVTNKRTLYNTLGEITVQKTWLNGDDNTLEPELTPANVEVQLYRSTDATSEKVEDAHTLSGTDWTTKYGENEKLPATDLSGNAYTYTIKEIADDADTDAVEDAELDNGAKARFVVDDTAYVFDVYIEGFSVTNKLCSNAPVNPTKTADAESSTNGVQIGDLITYTIERTSHLNKTTKATITDTLPVGLVYDKDDAGCTNTLTVNDTKVAADFDEGDGTVLTWTVENVPPMATVKVVFTARVTRDAVISDELTNTATVDLDDENDTAYDSPDEEVKVKRPKLRMVKEAQSDVVKPGDELTYELKVINEGDGRATEVEVTDKLPAQLEVVVSQLPEGLTYDSDEHTIIWTIDVIEAGATPSITFVTKVLDKDALDEDELPARITNIAEITDKPPTTPGEPEQGTDTEETPIARFEVEKTAEIIREGDSDDELDPDSDIASLNDIIRFTVTVTNSGACDLSNVVIDDEMIWRAIRSDIVVPPTQEEGTKILLAEELKAGEVITFTYDIQVQEEDLQLGEIVNVATVSVQDPTDPDKTIDEEDTTDTDTDEPNAHLTIVKTTTSKPANEETYVLGETITYEIVVTNDGNVTVKDIVVTDELTGKTWPIASLAPNASETFVETYEVKEADILAGEVVNVATATGESPDPEKPKVPVTPGEVEDPTEDPNAHLTIVKTTTSQPANGETYVLGETIEYEIVVTNDGNLTIENIEVTDDLTKATWSVGTLKPGESSEVLTTSHIVTEEDILKGTVLNVATATGESPDPEKPKVPVTPGEAEEDPEAPNGHLTVEKKTTSQPDNGETYVLGETITYEIVVTNDGNLTIENIEVTDDLTKETWDVGTLKPGESSEVLTTSYTVTEDDIVAGKVVNVATATGKSEDPDKDPEIIPGRTEDEVEEANPHLMVTKEVTNTPANGEYYEIGDVVTYKITVENDGNLTISDLEVIDTLTSDANREGTRLAVTGDGTTSLEPGQSCEFTCEYTVVEGDVLPAYMGLAALDPHKVLNSATATGTNPSKVEIMAETSEVVVPVAQYVTVMFVDTIDWHTIELVQVPYGGFTGEPDHPIHEGYYFERWYGGTWWDVYSDQIIYALYKPRAKAEITDAQIPMAGGYISNVGDCFD